VKQDASEAFENRFSENERARDFYLQKLAQYRSAGFDSPQFHADLNSGRESFFQQQIWEMMLGCHLLDLKLNVSAIHYNAPDFLVEHNGTRIWIEAISPEPKGIPTETLEPPSAEFLVTAHPHEAILLRWTAAISAKLDALTRYREKGVVSSNDCYLIAVNGCQLGWWLYPEGISQWPWAAEAALGIGPLTVTFDPGANNWGPMTNSARFSIQNANRSTIDTDSFWSDDYAGVSAILGTVEKNWSTGASAMSVVHNPKALVPLPRWLLGETLEVTSSIEGDMLTATKSHRD
tara:strand:+ start:324 stop:1196 length:873 start_codon:yes stop_codon:yes gene_type:complete